MSCDQPILPVISKITQTFWKLTVNSDVSGITSHEYFYIIYFLSCITNVYDGQLEIILGQAIIALGEYFYE